MWTTRELLSHHKIPIPDGATSYYTLMRREKYYISFSTPSGKIVRLLGSHQYYCLLQQGRAGNLRVFDIDPLH